MKNSNILLTNKLAEVTSEKDRIVEEKNAQLNQIYAENQRLLAEIHHLKHQLQGQTFSNILSLQLHEHADVIRAFKQQCEKVLIDNGINFRTNSSRSKYNSNSFCENNSSDNTHTNNNKNSNHSDSLSGSNSNFDSSNSYDYNKKSVIDDIEAFRFLNARAFVLEAAVLLYTEYVKYVKDTFGTYPIRINTEAFKSCMAQLTPFKDNAGRSIVVMRQKYIDPLAWKAKLKPAMFALIDLLSRDEEIMVNGYTLLIDMHDVQMSTFTLEYVSDHSKVVQEVVPVKRGHVLLVRNPGFFNIIYPIMTLFLTDSWKRKIININFDLPLLNNYITTNNLPPKLALALNDPSKFANIDNDDSDLNSPNALFFENWVATKFQLLPHLYVMK
eukprot:c18065_g1_i4.p1 GENE.c18065_g1_i4~~c18065_g1_i4.p1  ORF type:complete len:446 (+),score=-16.71 c18065_g1_i4:186-1340(+)